MFFLYNYTKSFPSTKAKLSMGNSQSGIHHGNGNGNNTNLADPKGIEKVDFANFYQAIDFIATHYILTMNFKSLSKLAEKKYCDKLIVLTSKIVERHYAAHEIDYLARRLEQGEPDAADPAATQDQMKREQVQYVLNQPENSDDDSGTTSSSPPMTEEEAQLNKQQKCIGIAKFYVKIAHVFAAILMTINPWYVFTNEIGETVKVNLMHRDLIPKEVKRKMIKFNICESRVRALRKQQRKDTRTSSSTTSENKNTAAAAVALTPISTSCKLNTTDDGRVKTLADEPGIMELERLYLDDQYDFSNGQFAGMSESTKQQYLRDLKLFYTAFTGNETMPPEITKFSDIQLKDYQKSPGCTAAAAAAAATASPNTALAADIPISTNNRHLFVQYAENIKSMIQSANDNQLKLMGVINELFTFVVNPQSNQKVIRINPRLTSERLQRAVETSRQLITQLYVQCETDYAIGLKIFEAIVESKTFETTQKQLANLEAQSNQLLKSTLSSAKQQRIGQSSSQPSPSTLSSSASSSFRPMTQPSLLPFSKPVVDATTPTLKQLDTSSSSSPFTKLSPPPPLPSFTNRQSVAPLSIPTPTSYLPTPTTPTKPSVTLERFGSPPLALSAKPHNLFLSPASTPSLSFPISERVNTMPSGITAINQRPTLPPPKYLADTATQQQQQFTANKASPKYSFQPMAANRKQELTVPLSPNVEYNNNKPFSKYVGLPLRENPTFQMKPPPMANSIESFQRDNNTDTDNNSIRIRRTIV